MDEEDPIYREDLWVRGEIVRYGDSSGSGVGYCASYLPFTAAGNHTRAVLCFDTEPCAGPAALQAFARRVALSCECVALLPTLEGGTERWPHERLAQEYLAACRYVNQAFGTEGLAVVALGSGARPTLELLASGGMDAHAAVVLGPRDLSTATRAVREIDVPLLAVCVGAADAADLRRGLEMNSRLARDYYVAHFDGQDPDFVLSPSGAMAESESSRALALVQAWVDRYVPENLGTA